MIKRQFWYQNRGVLFEIIHQLKHKETMFIPYKVVEGKWESELPIRWINAGFIKMLNRHFTEFRFLSECMNIYYSLAKYHLPMFAYNYGLKSRQQKVWLKEFKNYILGYDLFIETDSVDIGIAKEQSILIMDFLDEFGLRYSNKFSGSKGFHFITEYEDFKHLGIKIYDEALELKWIKDNFNNLMRKCPVVAEELDLVLLYKLINHKLSLLLGCDTVDTTITDIKRVCKAAYSWDVKSENIALPLTKKQLINFNLDIVKPEACISSVWKRGLLWSNENSIEERQGAVSRLLKELNIIKIK